MDLSERSRKWSVTLKGHRTSVNLEPQFWQGLKVAAAFRGLPVCALVEEIDAEPRSEVYRNLSSQCRLYVLRHYQDLFGRD